MELPRRLLEFDWELVSLSEHRQVITHCLPKDSLKEGVHHRPFCQKDLLPPLSRINENKGSGALASIRGTLAVAPTDGIEVTAIPTEVSPWPILMHHSFRRPPVAGVGTGR